MNEFGGSCTGGNVAANRMGTGKCAVRQLHALLDRPFARAVPWLALSNFCWPHGFGRMRQKIHALTICAARPLLQGDPIASGANTLAVEVKWQQNSIDETRYMDSINASIAEGSEGDAFVVAKYCSDNGGCNKKPARDGQDDIERWTSTRCDSNEGCISGMPLGTNDGRAYVPLIRRGIKVVFLEYAPNLTWAYSSDHDSQDYFSSVFPDDDPITEDQVRANSMLIKSDRASAGMMLGRLFCQETENEVVGRRILVLRGNVGHPGCEDMVNSFQDSLGRFCNSSHHQFPWDIHANFDKTEANKLAKALVLLDPTVNAVLACNDDMAMGAVGAINELAKAGVGKGKTPEERSQHHLAHFLSMGYDNVYGYNDEPGAAPMFVSIAWREGFVAGIKDLALMWSDSIPALDPSDVEEFLATCDSAKACPLKVAREVTTEVKTQINRLCSFKSIAACPAKLRTLLENNAPRAFGWPWEAVDNGTFFAGEELCDAEDDPAGSGLRCFGFWYTPLVEAFTIAVILPSLLVLSELVRVIFIVYASARVEHKHSHGGGNEEFQVGYLVIENMENHPYWRIGLEALPKTRFVSALYRTADSFAYGASASLCSLPGSVSSLCVDDFSDVHQPSAGASFSELHTQYGRSSARSSRAYTSCCVSSPGCITVGHAAELCLFSPGSYHELSSSLKVRSVLYIHIVDPDPDSPNHNMLNDGTLRMVLMACCQCLCPPLGALAASLFADSLIPNLCRIPDSSLSLSLSLCANRHARIAMHESSPNPPYGGQKIDGAVLWCVSILGKHRSQRNVFGSLPNASSRHKAHS
eukprot:SAG11_NODE_1924_length_4059_cov_10.067172_3_plen_811_part_00